MATQDLQIIKDSLNRIETKIDRHAEDLHEFKNEQIAKVTNIECSLTAVNKEVEGIKGGFKLFGNSIFSIVKDVVVAIILAWLGYQVVSEKPMLSAAPQHVQVKESENVR